MSEAGVYALVDILAGVAAAIMTSPLGHVQIPENSISSLISPPSGYEVVVGLANESPLGVVRGQGPVAVDLERIAPSFLAAVLAAEDARFGEHRGIDPFGTASAAIDMLRGRMRGGSGITQQMIKNTLVGPGVTFERKALEAILALRLHDHLGPNEVMRLYLENAWFGRGQMGVMNAPRAWFGKEWSKVTLAESAYLAALLKGPSRYDGYRHPERAKDRRDWILGRMLKLGWIDRKDHDLATAEPVLVLRPDDSGASPESTWALSLTASQMRRDMIGREIENSPDVVATLTIDPQWQMIAQDALAAAVSRIQGQTPLDRISLAGLTESDGHLVGNGLSDLRSHLLSLLPPFGGLIPAVILGSGRYAVPDSVGGLEIIEQRGSRERNLVRGDVVALQPLPEGGFDVRLSPGAEGAVVIIDPRSGAVLASIGGHDPRMSGFDRTRAQRQPGSAAKTFLWLAALDLGIRSDTLVPDIEQTYIIDGGQTWRPRNYDRSQSGMIPMFQAYERSSNLVAAQLAHLVGIDEMARIAELAGAWPEGGMGRNLAASLGTSETTLLDLTAAHAAIMNDAVPRRPHVIARLETSGRAVFDMTSGPFPRFMERGRGPVVSGRAMRDMLSMMRGVVMRGTAYQAFANHPVPIVGKTGTSQENRDAWFIGMTPHLAIGVWIGRDDNSPIPGGGTGGRLAAPVAAEILRIAHQHGLVDGQGLRDAILTSSIDWPPPLPVRGSGQAPQILPANSSFEPAPERPRIPSGSDANPFDASGSSDAPLFWGPFDDMR